LRLRWLGLGVFALALCLQTSASRAAGTPRALVPVQTYDFGTVEQGQKVSHCFELENRGNGPLEIVRMQLSLPDMSARVPASIPAGQTAKICIEFGTSTLDLKVRAQALLFTDDPSARQISLLVAGAVRAPIDFVPMSAVFAAVWKGEGSQSAIRIVNNRPEPLRVSGLNVEGKDFKAQLETQKPGRVYKLVVTIPHDLAPGYYGGTIDLNTDNPEYAHVRVPVNIVVRNEIYTFPLGINFGSISLAQINSNRDASDLEQWVLVKKRTGKFKITSIRSEVAAIQFTQSPQGESNTFRITATLARDGVRPGPLAGDIRVTTDDPATPELTIPVSGNIR